ncbi:hypothetical protein THIOKS1880001 [Thiocapsa sp. KS1]|nr:hypothetical protein THIOKS1880001 [Thiocapsa sp. KS1]
MTEAIRVLLARRCGFNSLNGYGLDDILRVLQGVRKRGFNSLNGYGLDDWRSASTTAFLFVSTA